MTWEEMTGYRSFEPSEGLAVCKAKAVPSFLIYFKTLTLSIQPSTAPVPGIEPATSRSAVKRRAY